MRDGFKIFDSDTHLNPLAETLEPYFDAAMRKRLPEWASCKVPFRTRLGRRDSRTAVSAPLPVQEKSRLA